jgi:hypothetical protein
MTQAFNLSQLANNLTTAGLLDAADGLVNAVPIVNGGTGATTAAAARSNLDVPQAVFAVPSGGIIIWSGSVASIPTGWFLCNGANGTPDLRNRFVLGAGSTYGVGVTGGTADAIVVAHSHTATSTDSGHIHNITGYQTLGGGGLPQYSATATNSAGWNSDTGYANITTTIASEGISGTNQNMPPYYALCFIMKS